jgi:hypothetical protein
VRIFDSGVREQGPRERSEWGCGRGESTLEADNGTVGILKSDVEAAA